MSAKRYTKSELEEVAEAIESFKRNAVTPFSRHQEALAVALAVERMIDRRASFEKPCPRPDVKGWTIRDCFKAHRCGCQEGQRLGYKPVPYSEPPEPGGERP